MKKLLSVLIILMLILSGCGSDDSSESVTENNDTQEETTPTNDTDTGTVEDGSSKTYNFVTNLYGTERYFMIYEDMSTSSLLEMYVDGERMAIYGSDMDNNESIMIYDEEFMYIIAPSEGIAYSMPIDNEDDESDEAYEEMEDDPESFTNVVETGTEEIDGTKYEYEEFSLEGEGVRYYYDSNRLKYIGYIGSESEGYLVRMVDYGNDFSNDVFEIPEGIELMNMEDMFNMNLEE